MKTTLCFTPDGSANCLYTEAIDLRVLGRLEVVRATDIRFNRSTQQWEVHDAGTGAVIFSDPSREACLQWERANLQPR